MQISRIVAGPARERRRIVQRNSPKHSASRQISNDLKDSTSLLRSAWGATRPINAGVAGDSLWNVSRRSLTTERLILGRWRASDRAPFRSMNADPRVMEFMPRLLTSEESDRLLERIEGHFEQHGFGLFAAEVRESGLFAGFVGLAVPEFTAPFTPCVEIGWRLACEYWGKGLATEGARGAALCFRRYRDGSSCLLHRSC
jgi:RimJ/RimL family protein N-acetyltransferase